MRIKLYSLLVAMIMSVATFSVSGADSGAVNEGLQVWDGKKVFLDNSPVSTTATGHLTLYKDSKRIQLIDANGSARNVTLPVETITQGWEFYIVNTSSGANALTIKGSAGGTVGTVNQYQSCYAWCNGTTWYTYVFTSTATGFVAADGTTVGATGQTQVFTNGVTADTFIGNTAAPVTITGKVGASAVGNAVTITGGAGNGAFDGGAVNLTGGASGVGATGNGGAIVLTGKVATSTNGNGGLVSSTAGAGVGSGAGGAVTDLAGAGGATGAGGAYTATAGRGGSTSGASGVATITAGAGGAGTTTTGGIASLVAGGSGTGATGNGGEAKVTGGAALSTAGNGGAVTITGGVGTTTGTSGGVTIRSGADGAGGTVGNIILDTGTATGTAGTMALGATNSGAMTIGRTGQTATFPGTVALAVTPTGDGIAMYKEVSITNAQMLDLADTPVELIAAVAGKIIEVQHVTFLFDYTAAYTVTANDDLDICYTSESNVIATGEATGFVDATADDTLLNVAFVANYAPAASVSVGANVVLANNSADFGGGNAANAVRVKISYRIWTSGF